MDRRRLLACCGAGLAGLAGCTGGETPTEGDRSSPNEDIDFETLTPTPEPAPGDAELAAVASRLQPGVAVSRTDSVVVTGEGNQYLYVVVDLEGTTPPPRSAFAFRFDGASHTPVDPVSFADGELYRAASGRGVGPYDRESGSGWLLFELPESGDPNDAALTWGGREWTPTSLPSDRLAAAPPSLSVSLSAPDSVAADGEDTTLSLSFSVTNDSDRETRFVAGLNRTGVVQSAVTAFDKWVPSGETATWTRDVPLPEVGGDGATVTAMLDWADGRRSVDVEVGTDGSD